MLIDIDFDLDAEGGILARQQVDTSDVNSLDMLVDLQKGRKNQTQAGWDVMSKHPQYPGKTRFEVMLAEIVRLDDKEARGALGV